MERGWRDITPNCPRCGSSNTKFCYYNNYSLTQPRYFCKGCRRYWTKGGSLRNVPVGGGCRKTRRSRSSSLRLVAAPNHHGVTHRSNSTPNFSHVDNNNIPSYDSNGDLSNMVESSTPQSMNSEAPNNIDLAVVYANFLNQKGAGSDQLRSSVAFCDHNTVVDSPNVDFSGIPGDAPIIVPSTQIINLIEHNNNPPFSQTLSMPQLSNDRDHNNQFFDPSNFDNSILHHPHEDASMQFGLESELLPSLPGELSSHKHQEMTIWSTSSKNDDNLQETPRLTTELEQEEAQFSNLFGGSWMSPLDLPGFETSSSQTKP